LILAFDTYYFETSAKTVALQFEDWTSEVATHSYEETLTEVEAYVSGQFYKRELPCILSLLTQIDTAHCKAIIIDGFVVLDDAGAKGLGGYLYDALDQSIPIIGVAKNDFATLDSSKRAVYRGTSKKPLYVTALGMDLDRAAENLQQMHGVFRMPTLLKMVDSLGRA
jgi:deoxyinosine 3'endonuclease (endonuclease V)